MLVEWLFSSQQPQTMQGDPPPLFFKLAQREKGRS
jgi:hypothetical protein